MKLRVVFLLLLATLLAACTAEPTPTLTATPTVRPTNTPTPAPMQEAPSSSLKLGHWANENGTHVSFNLSDDGNISNFEMTASFGTPTMKCTIKIDQLQMQVNNDGTFLISYSMEYADVETELGPALMSLGVIPEGQPYEVLHISGNITDTTMDGTFKINVCNHILYLHNNTGPWKAQWKNSYVQEVITAVVVTTPTPEPESVDSLQPATKTVSPPIVPTATPTSVQPTPTPTSIQPTPKLAQEDQLTLSEDAQAELIFTAPDYVWTLSSDNDGNLYIITDGGDILQIDADGNSQQVYNGLTRCGFSKSAMTILPNGDLVFNTCVDEKETLIKLDQEGNETTLVELDDSLLSMTSDADGNIYIGTWTSEGDITLNFNPTHLGGAVSITGQILMLSPDNTLTTIYEGGIPVALTAGNEGNVIAAIWGESGPFSPESKSFTVCSHLGIFWIGMSDQVKIMQVVAEQTITEDLNSVSTIGLANEDLVVAVGMRGDQCGIFFFETGQAPRKLSFSDDEIDNNIMGLTIAGGHLYFADVEGNVYRVR